MDSRLIVTVLTRGDELEQHVPGGFQVIDQMFEEAGLRDSVSAAHSDDFWRRLRVLRRALRRQFDRRVSMRVLNPWTPRGLWFIVRHRVRDFPCLVFAGQRYPLDASVQEIVEAIGQALQ